MCNHDIGNSLNAITFEVVSYQEYFIRSNIPILNTTKSIYFTDLAYKSNLYIKLNRLITQQTAMFTGYLKIYS